MTEPAKNKNEPKSKAEKRRLSEGPSLPSSSKLTLQSTRFDVDKSKTIFLEVASKLVAEKIIFSDFGRQKFCQKYKEQFPDLEDRSCDSVSNDESPTEPETQNTGKSKATSSYKKRSSDSFDKRHEMAFTNTTEIGKEMVIHSDDTGKQCEHRSASLNDTSTTLDSNEDQGLNLDDTEVIEMQALNSAEQGIQPTTSVINEDQGLNLDDTEVIELQTLNSSEQGIQPSSSKLSDKSEDQMSPTNVDHSGPAANDFESGNHPAAGNNFESVVNPAAGNDSESVGYPVTAYEIEDESPGRSSPTPVETSYRVSRVFKNQYSEDETSATTASGSKESLVLKGLTEDQKTLWIQYIETLNKDAISVSQKGSRGLQYAMAKKDLDPGDYVSHLRGRILPKLHAEKRQTTSKESKLFPLGRQYEHKYIDTGMNKDWPGNFVSTNHLAGNCEIMELQKGPKTYYCFYAKKCIKKGSNLVYCSRE